MNTRKLVALSIALAFAGLTGTGFAADQKAAPAQAPAASPTAQAPAADPAHPDKTKSKKQKHKKPAPDNKG